MTSSRLDRVRAVVVQDVEREFDVERRAARADADPLAWYTRLSREAVETLVSIGVPHPDARMSVLDFLQNAGSPDAALEGLVIMQRAAARSGDLDALASHFKISEVGDETAQ